LAKARRTPADRAWYHVTAIGERILPAAIVGKADGSFESATAESKHPIAPSVCRHRDG
jgi:hypothetical protein